MYNDEYDEQEESKSNGSFITNFYYNNKILIWILIGVIAFILIMSLLTRGGSSNNQISDYKLEIYPEGTVEVSIGNSKKLVASVNNDSNPAIIWTSSNDNIVKVDNGTVTGVNYGKAMVKAKYLYGTNQSIEVEKEVIVADGNPNLTLTDVSFKDGSLLMPVNSTYTISLGLTPSNGYVTSKEFISSNEQVVKVDNAGVVQSVGVGEATISLNVNNGSFRKSLKVYVSNDYTKSEIIVTPERIKFDGELRKMKIGTSEKLSYTVFPDDVDKTKLMWESSDSSIVSVDENGIVRALKEGRAVITLKSITGVNDTLDIEVESDIVLVTDINLSMDSLYLSVGGSQTITPIVIPNDASNKSLSYTSTDGSIVSVSSNDAGTAATITGLRAGVATVIIKSNNNVERRLNVTVTGGSNSGGNSSGGSSGESSSTASQGFTISSSDAEGGKFINSTYEATELKNNGAKAPVKVTLTITDSSITTLRVAVCLYSSSATCNPSNSGVHVINGSGSFTMYSKGAYILAVGKYNSSGTHVGTVYKYIWIKEGSSGSSATTTSSSSYACFCRYSSSDGEYYCTWATAGNSSFPNKNTVFNTQDKCNAHVETTCCHIDTKSSTLKYVNSTTIKGNCVDQSKCTNSSSSSTSTTSSGSKTSTKINLSKTLVALSSNNGSGSFTETATTLSGMTVSGAFTNTSSNSLCATVSKSGSTVTVIGKNTSTTSSCTATITVSFTPSSTSTYSTPSSQTVVVTVPKAASSNSSTSSTNSGTSTTLYCSPEGSPYQKEVSASFCNDTYNSYTQLKNGAKTKLQSAGKYDKYYGCLKTSSGKYNVYECYMK